jgi:hypothetical protein
LPRAGARTKDLCVRRPSPPDRARFSPAAPAALAALVLLGALVSGACHPRARGRGAGHVRRDAALGTLDRVGTSAGELGEDLAYARAVLEGRNDATPPAHARRPAPRRAFLSAFSAGAPPRVTTALAPTLGEALAISAQELRASVRVGGLDTASVRLGLDVVVGRGQATPASSAQEAPSLASLGAGGFAVACADARLGYVLPGELVTRGLIGDEDGEPVLERARFDALLTTRLAGPSAGCRRLRLATTSVVEAGATRPSGGAVVPLVRGRPPRPPPASLDAPLLTRRVRLGADYLARALGADGRFVYLYDPRRDAPVDDDYNVIRHAGAADALFEAYEELGDARHLAAGERALGWLDDQLRARGAGADAADEIAWLPSESNALSPIGGTGLALVAFAKHAAVTRSTRYLARMRAMGNFLVRQLAPDGHFEPFFEGGAPRPWSYVLYYHGEAMLGLMRLYALDRDPRWLDALVRAARHRLATPYEHPREAGRDYWLALSLAELSRATHDAAFSARAFTIAEASMREWDEDEADVRESGGAWSTAPRCSPTATMSEALTATIALARHLGLEESRMLEHARRATSFVLGAQLDEDGVYAARAPNTALGGVHGDPWTDVVRIDDVQHAMMAMLGLLRAVRDPSFGRAGSPSPLGVAPLAGP